MSIIVLNGPPGSGKDTVADFLSANYGFNHIAFKDELYKEAARVSGLPYDFLKFLATDRKLKELPNSNFTLSGRNVSPREFLIHVSENIIKPLKGLGYFGEKTAERADHFDKVAISDGGFEEEFYPLVDLAADSGRPLLVVHLFKEGCSFEGDSRDYLSRTFLETFTGPDAHLELCLTELHNTQSSAQEFAEYAARELKLWI